MTAPSLTLRRYEESDSEQVWTVHERALRASPLEFIEDAPDDDLADITGHYLDSGGEFLVGLADGDIVATGGFQPEEDGETDEYDTAEILRMRVHPDYQRRGYGEQVLEELERRAGERGFDTLVLYTNEKLTAARNLYEKHDYEETYRETIQTDDTFIHYRKRLDSRGRNAGEN